MEGTILDASPVVTAHSVVREVLCSVAKDELADRRPQTVGHHLHFLHQYREDRKVLLKAAVDRSPLKEQDVIDSRVRNGHSHADQGVERRPALHEDQIAAA